MLTQLSRFACGFRFLRFLKSLIWFGWSGSRRRESAVVKTKAIFSGDFLRIIADCHVFAPDDSQEGRQGAPLLEHCREQARERWTRCATARAVFGGDQLIAGTGVAQVH